MSRNQINTSLDNDQDHETKPVTGTQSGSKRYLDTSEINSANLVTLITALNALITTLNAQDAQSMAQEILDTIISGTLPRDSFNDISLSLTGTDYTYTLKYNDVRQFVVTISDPTGNYSTAIVEINNLLKEDGGVRLKEDGGERLKEG